MSRRALEALATPLMNHTPPSPTAVRCPEKSGAVGSGGTPPLRAGSNASSSTWRSAGMASTTTTRFPTTRQPGWESPRPLHRGVREHRPAAIPQVVDTSPIWPSARRPTTQRISSPHRLHVGESSSAAPDLIRHSPPFICATVSRSSTASPRSRGESPARLFPRAPAPERLPPKPLLVADAGRLRGTVRAAGSRGLRVISPGGPGRLWDSVRPR